MSCHPIHLWFSEAQQNEWNAKRTTKVLCRKCNGDDDEGQDPAELNKTYKCTSCGEEWQKADFTEWSLRKYLESYAAQLKCARCEVKSDPRVASKLLDVHRCTNCNTDLPLSKFAPKGIKEVAYTDWAKLIQKRCEACQYPVTHGSDIL